MVLVTLSVEKGLGKHVWAVSPDNFNFIGIIGNFTGTYSILAAVWSTTSFAQTLPLLMPGKMKIVLWTIIILMNIFMDLNALFLWVRCTPTEKTWNPMVPGTCWGPNVYTDYGMFAAGKPNTPFLTASIDPTADSPAF